MARIKLFTPWGMMGMGFSSMGDAFIDAYTKMRKLRQAEAKEEREAAWQQDYAGMLRQQMEQLGEHRKATAIHQQMSDRIKLAEALLKEGFTEQANAIMQEPEVQKYMGKIPPWKKAEGSSLEAKIEAARAAGLPEPLIQAMIYHSMTGTNAPAGAFKGAGGGGAAGAGGGGGGGGGAAGGGLYFMGTDEAGNPKVFSGTDLGLPSGVTGKHVRNLPGAGKVGPQAKPFKPDTETTQAELKKQITLYEQNLKERGKFFADQQWQLFNNGRRAQNFMPYKLQPQQSKGLFGGVSTAFVPIPDLQQQPKPLQQPTGVKPPPFAKPPDEKPPAKRKLFDTTVTLP